MSEYISREEVVRYLKGYSDKECNSNSPYGMITSSVLNKVERALSEMPAANVQSVRHGHWKEEHYDDLLQCFSAICSECGYESTDHYSIIDNHRYCEYCGARMDGDTNGI